MKIAPELIEELHLIKAGKVYYGAFARDDSDHAAVVVSIYNDTVNYFSITSSRNFIEGIQRNRDPEAIVELTEEETKLFFPDNPKKDWIYCGIANWQIKKYKDFAADYAAGKIRLVGNATEALFRRVIKAIRGSITYTHRNLVEMGLEEE